MASKLPSAEKFQDWVCEEVLPSIRKTGSYHVAPKNYIEALEQALKLAKENEQLRLEAINSKPKVDYYDVFINTTNLITIREYAYQLNINEQTLIGFLVGIKHLYYTKGRIKKILPMKSRRDYFELRDYCDETSSGRRLYITPKGKAEIFVKLKNEGLIDVDNIRID